MSYFKKTKNRVALLLGTAMLFTATTALATPVTGDISFSGSMSYLDSASVATPDPLLAVGIEFVPLSTITTSFSSHTGTYASVDFGAGTSLDVGFMDFTFSPTMSPSPVAPLWTFTDDSGLTYSFDMASVSVTTQTAATLALSGTGTLMATGFDNSAGTWSFTSQAGSSVMTFSSTSVPEPGLLFVLGTGLIGLLMIARHKETFTDTAV